MDLEAAITSSTNMEDRRREETRRPRMSADMYKAAKSNNVGYFRHLLGSNRSVDAVDHVLASITLSGKTVAHVAAIFNSKEVMEEVCKQSEALLTTADFMGATPLHEAAAHGHAEVVAVMVRCARGSSKLAEMLYMRTPGTAMELAVVNNHLKVVKALAEAEPRLLFPRLLWPYEDYRQSALDQASVRGYWEVFEFILAHMPLAPDRLQYSGGDTPLHRAIAQERTGYISLSY